jgi:hypothetical protein
MKQLPHVGAVPKRPITAEVASLAVTTDISCACVHGAAAGPARGSDAGSESTTEPESPLDDGAAVVGVAVAHAIAQLVESVAVAHPIRHCPHGGLLPISAITADVLSAAVPTFVTSAIVHDAASEQVKETARTRSPIA